jgi:hypothetical protein
MNKHLILLLLMLAALSANAKKVKFSVDMTGQTLSPNGVHVAGDFQDEAGYAGGDWQSNTTEMTSEAGTQIYSVVVDIPAFAKYEYKFINGDEWYEVEFVPLESRVGYDFNDNRWVYVDSLFNDTTLIPPVLFSGNAPAGHYLLRLKVDMSLEESIDPAGVYIVANEYIGTIPQTKTYSFGNNVYEHIMYVDILTDYSNCYYLFVNGNTLEGYETLPAACSVDGYRFIEINNHTELETVCFSECVSCDAIGTVEHSLSSNPLLYPNPCKESVLLNFNDLEVNHSVQLIDILGNTVKQFYNYTGQSLVITCDKLWPGVYFVRINSGERWLNTLRLVISN